MTRHQKFTVFVGASFVIGILALTAVLAFGNHYPEPMAFLNESVVVAEGGCTQKATGQEFYCEFLVDPKTGDEYMAVWTTDRKAIVEVMKADGKTKEIITIYKREARCDSTTCV